MDLHVDHINIGSKSINIIRRSTNSGRFKWDVILKQHNVLEVLKSAGILPKSEGHIVQVLDSIRRWEEQFLQVLRGLNLGCIV